LGIQNETRKNNKGGMMNEMRQFEIKEEHIKLLRAMNVSWWDAEFGAPCIDPKRPYGNSDVHEDMIRILGWEKKVTVEVNGIKCDITDLEYDMPDKIFEMLDSLHAETERALQICLVVGKFEPGIYTAGEYRDNWEKMEGRGE